MEFESKAESKAEKLLENKIQESQKLTELEQEKERIQKARLDYLRTSLYHLGVQFSRTTPALVILVICVMAGAWGGLNFLPKAVYCQSLQSLCYNWRLDKKTTIVPETAGSIRQVPVEPGKKGRK